MRLLARILTLASLSALAAAPAFAQSKTGTTLGQFLLIEPSARIAGMGNAGTSLMIEGLDGAYYNPATVSDLDRWTLQFSHSRWIADIAYDYVAAALPMGRFGIGFVSLTALGSGEIDVRTVEQPLGTGARFTVSDLAVGLGMAKRITDRFSAGGRVSYVQETIYNSSTHTTTFDIGTLFQLSDEGLRIGSSLSNYGTQAGFSGRDLQFVYDANHDTHGDNSALPGEGFTDDFPVPVLFRVGLSLPRRVAGVGKLLVAADAFHPSDNGESLSLGAELTVRDMISVRAGYQELFLADVEGGLAAGGGFRGAFDERKYRIDYAWSDHGRLGGTHRFTLGFSF